ncbi:hypothetical protein [Clostridium subterminale]|uniref:hypothetical protein n=1 Tax=Clostridium subterminale TaxID=1550 RepID=UPI0031DBAD0A
MALLKVTVIKYTSYENIGGRPIQLGLIIIFFLLSKDVSTHTCALDIHLNLAAVPVIKN